MDTPTYSRIQEILAETDLGGLPPLRIAVLRNITLEPIESYLRYFSLKMGYAAEVRFGEFDNIIQEAIGGRADLLNEATDCVLLFMKLEALSWDLARRFPALAADRVNAEVERIEGELLAILGGIRRQTDAMILWHGFELPDYPALGIYDGQAQQGQLATVDALNAYLSGLLRNATNAYFVDIRLLVSRIGMRRFYDPRYWHLGRAPYSREALSAIAEEAFKFLRALKGKNKKCLVLDCDDTLWGGIVGEDGPAAIKLSRTDAGGSPYYEFQQEVLNLYDRGVILALCSRNNEADVWEVFDSHPDMVLRRDHVAAARINWQDKVANLREIARELNIGLDSMVFVDDSEFEIGMVQAQLPEVETLHLPPTRAVEYRDMLAACGWFDTLTVSAEDQMRGAMYKAEAARDAARAEAIDLDSYFRSLAMVVEVGFADAFSIPRVAQQTQKTNQFNLTTRRYSEADIRRFVDSEASDVIVLRLRDRLGDSGIVGAAILRYEQDVAVFDTMLLSCRVLGRGVENAFISELLKLARKRGCRQARGEYLATRKNGQVETFYAKCGFDEIDSGVGNGDRIFDYDLEREPPAEPDYFHRIDSVI